MTIQTTPSLPVETKTVAIWPFMLAASVAIIAAILAYALWAYPGCDDEKALWGQFGDFMGGTLNPILSFLALIALVRTLALQNKQLGLSKTAIDQSREELSLTRGELQRTAAAQEQSAKLQAEQAKYALISAKLTSLSLANEHVSRMLTNIYEAGEDLTAEDMRNKKELVEIRSTQISQILKMSVDLCGTQI